MGILQEQPNYIKYTKLFTRSHFTKCVICATFSFPKVLFTLNFNVVRAFDKNETTAVRNMLNCET
jgi:hypothetical protein